MVIWLLDCSNGCVTKVKLSAEREKELDHLLDEENGDMVDFISKYEDEFGISASSSVWMTSNDENVYEVDF